MVIKFYRKDLKVQLIHFLPLGSRLLARSLDYLLARNLENFQFVFDIASRNIFKVGALIYVLCNKETTVLMKNM